MLTVRQVLASSSKLSAVNIAGGALAAAANLLVARRLGPEAMGVVGMAQLWILYGSLARPGILQAGYREMLHDMGRGDQGRAVRTQNVMATGEAALLALPAAVFAAAALTAFPDPQHRLALVVAALVFVSASLFQIADTIQWAYQRFELITRVSMLQKLSSPIFLLIGAYIFGVPGVVAAPGLAATACLIYYARRTAAVKISPAWDWIEIKRLIRIGLPLALYGFLYWGFRTSDRAMVAAWLSLESLGYFTFAMLFINQGCQAVSDFLNVLQASLFTELGKVGSVRPLAFKLQRISLLILLTTGASSAVAQALFFPAVALAAPKFIPGVPAFDVLALNLVATCAPLMAFSVLISAVVDRQNAAAALQAAGLALNVILGWSAAKTGLGLVGIAWSSAISQLAIAAAAHAFLHRRLFEGAPRTEPLRYYAWAAVLLALPIGVYFLYQAGLPKPAPGMLLWPTILRLAAGAAIWLAAGALVHKYWWGQTPR